MKPPLTARQAEVLDFIKSHIATHQRPPTLRAIRTELKITSTNGARDHLVLIAKKGYLRLVPGVANGIQVVEDDPESDELCKALVTANGAHRTPESTRLRARLAEVLSEALRLERAIAALEEV